MKNRTSLYVSRTLSLCMLAGMLANAVSNKAFTNTQETTHHPYPHHLQTLCNEMGTLSYEVIDKFEALRKIIDELKKATPVKLYPKVFKEHGVDFTALGENTSHIHLNVRKLLYKLIAAAEEFREKKLIDLKQRIIVLQGNYMVDKMQLQEIERTINHVASHGTTEQMLNTFYEQEQKLMLLENPELLVKQKEITYEEGVAPATYEVITILPLPLKKQGDERLEAIEHREEEEKEHKTERQQDDHVSLNNGDLSEMYHKLTAHVKGRKKVS